MSTYITLQMRNEALSVDLYDWLLEHHPHDVHTSYNSVLLNADDHVSVKVGFHGYTNWKTSDTGNNIDYLMNFLGYDYPSAVLALLDRDPNTMDPSKNIMHTTSSRLTEPHETHVKHADVHPFTIPPRAQSYKRVFAYLTKQRHIPADMIQFLIDRHLLYESDTHNAVFMNTEYTYYELRGTSTYADMRCKRRDRCSRFTECEHGWCRLASSCNEYKKSPFHGTRSLNETKLWFMQPLPDSPLKSVYVCEGAIDAISLCVMHMRNGLTHTGYAAIGGAAKQVKIDWLVQHISADIIIATDNDEAGDSTRSRNPSLKTIRPVTHDWNDDLRAAECIT